MFLIKILTRIITLVACSALVNTSAADPVPLNIALVAPFTGIYAGYGNQLLAGAIQAANDININGGIRGVKIEIVPIDDQCSPDLAIKQAEKIIASHSYSAVIGHTCSAAALATANLYANANLLVISPTATNPKITQRHIATQFRISGTDLQQGHAAANFIANKLHCKRVAVLHDQDLYSKDLADIVSENLTKLGVTPIMYHAVHRGTKNFNSIVKKIKHLNADAVYFAGLYPEVSSLANSLHALELQIPFITADGVALDKFAQAVGGAKIADTILMTFSNDPHNLISSKTVIARMQQNKMETKGYALHAYATVQVIAHALEHANSIDGKDLAHYLHQHEVPTVLGNKSWDTNGDVNATEFKIYSWRKATSLESIS